MDTLLEQLEALTISEVGRAQLKVLLAERSQDMHKDITDQQRSSAALMLGVMDKVLEETAIATDSPIPSPTPPPFPDSTQKEPD
jgi:hypothetical protein